MGTDGQTDWGLTMKIFFLNKKTVTNIVADTMAHISTCNYNTGDVPCHYCLCPWSVHVCYKFCRKKSLQLHIGRGNYQQLKADKPCEHVHHRVTQGLIFTQSEPAEIRLTFCIEITNPGMQVSYIHTSDWIHGYSELSAPTWRCHQMETFSALLALCAGNSPVTSEFPSQGQWRRALTFSLTCAWINSWINNRESGDLRCNRVHYDVTVMNECRDYETV